VTSILVAHVSKSGYLYLYLYLYIYMCVCIIFHFETEKLFFLE